MPRSYWRYVLAALGLIVSALLTWGAIEGYQRFNEATKDRYAAERYQPARDARLPPPSPKQKGQPHPYQPNCQNPQSHADSDLCAQWSSVKAVQETNRLTRLALSLAALGFIFAVFGAFVGIAGTVLIWLAWKETRAANQISERQLEESGRPHMLLDKAAIASLKDLPLADEFAVTFTFINRGSGPAWMREYGLGGWIKQAGEQCIIDENELARSEALWSVEPNGGGWKVTEDDPPKLTISQPQREAVLAGTYVLFVAIMIKYVDASGAMHEHRLVLRYEGATTERLVPANNPFACYT